MKKEIPVIEKALLRGTWTAETECGTSELVDLAKAAIEGRFRDALTSHQARKLFRVKSASYEDPFDQILDFSLSSDDDQTESEITRLILAVACIRAFVQTNWTGPDLDVCPLDLIQLLDGFSDTISAEEFLNRKAIAELTQSGEPAYHLTKFAAFLRFAQILLSLPYDHCLSAPWWRLRATFIHQQLLDEPVPHPASLLSSLESLISGYSSEPDLVGRLILEQGLLEHQIAHDRSAAELFVRAAKATGLEYELTGALGKRTKFQENDLSQLVLLAESHLPDDVTSSIKNLSIDGKEKQVDSSAKGVVSQSNVPETLALNDDTLLEQTEFTSSRPSAPGSRLNHINPSSQPPLHPLDQCVFLAMCLNVKNTSPSHGLTNEQMHPYVARVITHPRNWSIHTMALLLRSRLESSRTRTAERSTLQLQALIDQMPTADSALQERLLYFHSIPLPSKWELERELGLRFFGLGVVRSALEIFERLEMWEEVVKCWVALERSDKALAIVRDLLEGRKAEADEVMSRGRIASTDRKKIHDDAREAKLWCLLGDLQPENAIENYERAWKISKGTSGRAMRSLGGYHFARGNYKESISCLKRAVAINPLLAKSWFILGCAATRIEDWQEGKNAFSRCVAIDEDDGESWSNLASMYLRIGDSAGQDDDDKNDDNNGGVAATKSDPKKISFQNKTLAYRALKQGLKSSYDNWRMWHNYMVVAMDVGELSESCRALGRVVEETSAKMGADSIDLEVLERLVTAVTRAPSDPQEAAAQAGGGVSPNEGHGLFRSVNRLFEFTLLPRVSSSPRVFRAYGRLLTWGGRWEDALKAYLDGYRCSTAGTMEKGESDVARWREAVEEIKDIVDILQNFGPRVGEGSKWRLQARSIVRTFVGRTKENFEDEPEWGKIAELQDEFSRKDVVD